MITNQQIENRKYWINKMYQLSSNFGEGSESIEQEIAQEMRDNGIDYIIGHLRLCGVIPEQYGYDSTKEKLYSKYTDVVIHQAFSVIGLTSLVLKGRVDVADVECVSSEFSFVADAKAFRLSRTAKNQKDLKIQAMDNWKHGKPFAMVVCPVYQLPSRSSQIYHQAAARSVCVGTYTHLAVLARYAELANRQKALGLLHDVFKTVDAMNPSKDAVAYWQAVNRVFINSGSNLNKIWREEKQASSESIHISRNEALEFLATERERIIRLSRRNAVQELLHKSKLINRIKVVESVTENEILNIE